MQLRTTAVSQVIAFLREAIVTDCSNQSDSVHHVRGVKVTQMNDGKNEDRSGSDALIPSLDQLSGSVNLMVDQLLAEIRREN